MIGKLRLIAVGGFLVVGGGYALKTYLDIQANVVFVDNALEQAVELSLDGTPLGPVPAASSAVHDVEPGTHELVATGPAGEVFRATFEVPETGFRGLASLGGSEYVVVRARYDAAGGDTQYQALTAADGLLQLPADVAPDGIDLTFPESMTTNGNAVTLTYLCHFDAETETVGCPGA